MSSMSTLCQTFPTEVTARRAIEDLRTAGVPARDVRLLKGSALGDVRRQPVGGYAAAVTPDATVGSYAGRAVLRRQGTGGFAGDPDQRRQGSFADTDRVVIVTYDDHAEHTRVTGLRGIRRLLARAELDEHTLHAAVNELHAGHVVLLVNRREPAATLTQRQLDEVAARRLTAVAR
jgi:hypothetical protein